MHSRCAVVHMDPTVLITDGLGSPGDSKYNERNVEKVLHLYDLNYIPEPSYRHIKIFVCSHHEEFEFERHLIASIILPDLQNFCLHYGYDVQLLDFNVCFPLDPFYDSHLYEYSITCLEECFTQSRGVFFIGCLGDKDGIIPLPANISAADMETITSYILDDNKKMNLLREWYSENNVTTPFYSLEPLTKIFPSYYKKGNPEKYKAEHAKWVKTHKELTNLLHDVSRKAYSEGRMDSEMCTKSAMATQFRKAFTLMSTNPDNNCILLTRENAKGLNGEVNRQFREHPHTYNIPKYGRMSTVITSDKSILENILLQEVSPRIKSLIQTAIYKGASKTIKITDPLLKEVYKEALIHLNHYKHLRDSILNMVPQQDIYNEIKLSWSKTLEKLTASASKPGAPVPSSSPDLQSSQNLTILVGGEGTGKSSLIVQLVKLAAITFPRDRHKDTGIVIRYCALTPKSINSSQLLRSLCIQLYYILRQDPSRASSCGLMGEDDQEGSIKLSQYDTYNLARLVDEFANLIRVFGQKRYVDRRQLTIFIEDFHHLYKPSWFSSPGSAASSFSLSGGTNPATPAISAPTTKKDGSAPFLRKLLPTVLPPNVRIVITINVSKYVLESATLLCGTQTVASTKTISINAVANAQSQPQNTVIPPTTSNFVTEKNSITAPVIARIVEDLQAQFGPRAQIICLDGGSSPSPKGNASRNYDDDQSNAVNNPLTLQEIFLSCYKHSKIGVEPRWMNSAKEQHQITIGMPTHQKNMVNQALLTGKTPLYAELVSVYAKDWHTKFKPQANSLPPSILLAVKGIFDNIDQTLDHNAFIAVLKYISSANIGLTEVELLDLLSCNKGLMEVFYGNALTVDVRFPYYMWLLIKRQLSLLLTQKIIDGKILWFWNHKILSDVAKMYAIQRPVEKTQIHCDMANLFLETIYLAKETNTSNILPSTTIPLNYRGITPQPLLYNEYQYNMRRIHELWFHLLNTGDIKLLKFHALCNFDYLMAVVHGASLGYLYHMFDKTLQRFLDYEIQTLCATLIKSVNILSKDYLQLACEIIGRLRNVDENILPYLDNLVIQAMEWCDSYTYPLLVPLSSWLEITTPDLYDAFFAIGTNNGLAILAPSSQHILLTTKTNQIHMYHLASHEYIRPFKGVKTDITALVIAYNSSFVACATADLNIYFWRIEKNEISGSLRPHEKEITCMLLSMDDKLIFTGSKDCRICWCNVANHDIVKLINAHRGPVTGLVLNSFGEVLASTSVDCTIKLWLIETGTPLNFIEDISFPVRKISLSSDDIFLAVLCEEYHIQLRALTTGTFLYRLDHKIPVTDLCFTGDSRLLALGCKDAKIYLYHIHSQVLHSILNGHAAQVRNVMVTMNNDFLVSTSHDAVFIWNIKKPMKQENILNHKGIVSCIKISKDGSLALSGSDDGTVKLWNLEFSELQEKLPDHTRAVTCVGFSPQGNYVVSGSKDATINIKQLSEASSFIRFTGHNSPITNAVFTQDEKSIISSEFNDIVKVWRVETGFTLLNCSVFSRILMVSPNSLFAVSGNRTNSMKIWKVDDGKLINSITHSAEISCVSITENSKICVTGSKDESLKVWELTTGKLTQVLVGHNQEVTCVVTSQNNQKVISGAKDCSVIMWSVETGTTLRSFDDHTQDITSVAITQDNSIIISSSLDGTLRVWNSEKGNLITIFDCHSPVQNFCMSPDATHIIVRLNDPHVLLMCLHNSPATEFKAQTQQSSIDEESNAKTLPIKMKPYRFSLYLGKNLIPKISSATLPDQPLNANPLANMNNNNNNLTGANLPPMQAGRMGKGQPKLLRKQDSMSKIFFQTHHPFPSSPKMNDLIPDMNMEAKDKIIDMGIEELKNQAQVGNTKNALTNKTLEIQGQAEMLKAMTCAIQ